MSVLTEAEEAVARTVGQRVKTAFGMTSNSAEAIVNRSENLFTHNPGDIFSDLARRFEPNSFAFSSEEANLFRTNPAALQVASEYASEGLSGAFAKAGARPEITGEAGRTIGGLWKDIAAMRINPSGGEGQISAHNMGMFQQAKKRHAAVSVNPSPTIGANQSVVSPNPVQTVQANAPVNLTPSSGTPVPPPIRMPPPSMVANAPYIPPPPTSSQPRGSLVQDMWKGATSDWSGTGGHLAGGAGLGAGVGSLMAGGGMFGPALAGAPIGAATHALLGALDAPLKQFSAGVDSDSITGTVLGGISHITSGEGRRLASMSAGAFGAIGFAAHRNRRRGFNRDRGNRFG